MNNPQRRIGLLVGAIALFGASVVGITRNSSAAVVSYNTSCPDPNDPAATCDVVWNNHVNNVVNHCNTAGTCGVTSGSACLTSHNPPAHGGPEKGWWTMKTVPAGGSAFTTLYCNTLDRTVPMLKYKGTFLDGATHTCWADGQVNDDNYDFPGGSACGVHPCCGSYYDSGHLP